MSDTYDFVIVGGGIAGVATALHLAEARAGSVLLVEQSFLGSGATAYSSGGVRQQFSTPLEIELSIRALEFWRSASVRFAAPCVFTETGYLFVTTRDDVLDRLGDAARLQSEMGAGPVSMLSAGDVAQIAPWMRTDDLAGGCWTPRDGRMVPADAVAAMARAARRAGATVREHTPVTHIERAGDRFRVVGSFEVLAHHLVVAAGLATPALLSPLGHEVDVRPWMIHYAYTEPALAGFSLPTMIDLDLGMTVKRDGHGLNVGILDEASGLDSSPFDMLEAFFTAAAQRAPSLTEVGVVRTISANADLSIDGHPYAGMLEPGLWVLAGFGGHGTMHGPIVSQWLVESVLGLDDGRRLAPFDPRRRPTAGNDEWMVASRKA